MCRVAAGSDSGSFEDDFTFIFSSEPKTKDYYLLRYILLWSFGSELKMKVKSSSKLPLSLPAATLPKTTVEFNNFKKYRGSPTYVKIINAVLAYVLESGGILR